VALPPPAAAAAAAAAARPFLPLPLVLPAVLLAGLPAAAPVESSAVAELKMKKQGIAATCKIK
jgi:hypothetical protein